MSPRREIARGGKRLRPRPLNASTISWPPLATDRPFRSSLQEIGDHHDRCPYRGFPVPPREYRSVHDSPPVIKPYHQPDLTEMLALGSYLQGEMALSTS